MHRPTLADVHYAPTMGEPYAAPIFPLLSLSLFLLLRFASLGFPFLFLMFLLLLQFDHPGPLLPRPQRHLIGIVPEIVQSQRRGVVRNLIVPQSRPSPLNETPGVLLGRRQAEPEEQIRESYPVPLHFFRGHCNARQGIGILRPPPSALLIFGAAAEHALGGVVNLLQAVPPVQQRRRLVGQHHLGLIDIGPLQLFQCTNLLQRQFRKQFEESHDVLVAGIPPELPIIVLRQPIGIEPYRPPRGLAHLFAVRRGDEGGRQREQSSGIDASSQFGPRYHIPPLIGSAQLKPDVVSAGQFQKIVRLEYHVIEFQKGEGRLPGQALLDRFEAEHPIDGELRAVIAEELEVGYFREPVVVVHHDGVGGGGVGVGVIVAFEGEEFLEYLGDAVGVLLDDLVGQLRTTLVLPRRISHLGRPPSDQHHGTMPRSLKMTEYHNLQERTDVEGIGGGVESQIGRDDGFFVALLRQCVVQIDNVGALMKKTSIAHGP
mmetsp:Transcript_25493/g.75110  ORF Transcript_25493/g.75110 Transcript_25493/m.75110 type:complete len:487 (-) Transcript_25493:652-2112(-)